jgi:exoribonuclease II
MYVLFEEGGKFLAGRVLSQAEASLQVELDSGKRVKLKSALALLQFEKPAPVDASRYHGAHHGCEPGLGVCC